MSCKRIADPLQFIQRGFQRPLLDPAFAHDIAQQGDANVTHLRQRASERVSHPRSCQTTCEQFSSTTPQRSSQRRESASWLLLSWLT